MSLLGNEIGPDDKTRAPEQDADLLITIVVDQQNHNYGFNIRGLGCLKFIRPFIAAARWADDVKTPLEAAWYALLSAFRSLSNTNLDKMRERAKTSEIRVTINSTNRHFINSLVLFNSGVDGQRSVAERDSILSARPCWRLRR